MVARLTEHRWTMLERLRYQVPCLPESLPSVGAPPSGIGMKLTE